jgi:hypothetical protein
MLITTARRPLPPKIVITNRAVEARAQSVSVLDCDLQPDFTTAVFRFAPP